MNIGGQSLSKLGNFGNFGNLMIIPTRTWTTLERKKGSKKIRDTMKTYYTILSSC